MKRVRALPTMFTLGNLVAGFAAVTLATRSADPVLSAEQVARLQFNAALFVFLAMVCDALDGRVARLAGMASRFGAQLDSLADMVSFGLAPAVLVRSVLVRAAWPDLAARVTWVALAFYVAAAAVRLARYNVEALSPADGRAISRGKDYFVGLPSPAAAGGAVSIVMLRLWLAERGAPAWQLQALGLALPPVVVLLAALMVSRVRYLHVGNRFFAGRQRLLPVMLALVVLALVVQFPEPAAAGVFGTYVVGSLAWDAARHAANTRARRRLLRSGKAPGGPER